MVLYLSMFSVIISSTMDGHNNGGLPAVAIGAMIVCGITWLAAAATGVAWAFNVATGLREKLPAGTTMKIRRFYFAFFFPMAYILVMLIVGGMALANPESLENGSGPQEIPGFVAFIPFFFIVHFFAMACIFYNLYFISKSLKAVELNREPALNEYIPDFILMWFFIVGVWFIQPRINKIFSGETEKPVGGPIDLA
jgi:hypothetical protein